MILQPNLGSIRASRRAEHLLLYSLTCLSTPLPSIRSVVPGVRLVPSDDYRHTCQLYADDVVLLSESQIDLQAGLNACHAWRIRWCFTFGVGPTKSAAMVFGPARSCPDCHVHLGGVPLPVVTQYRYLGVVLTPDLSWRAHVAHVSSRLFHQSARGAVVKVCPSVSLSPCLTRTFSRGPVLDWSSWATMLQLLPRLIWRSAVGAANSLGGPAPRRSLPSTGKLALATLCVWSSAEHFRCLAVCAPWTLLALDLLCPQPFSGFVPTCGALGPTGALQLCAHCQFLLPPREFGISACSPMVAVARWCSREVRVCLDRDFHHRLAAMAADLQGSGCDVRPSSTRPRQHSLLSQLPVRLVSAMGTCSLGPRPLCRSARHQNSPEGCRLCHADDGSLIHHLTVCPCHNSARDVWAQSCGLAPSEASAWASHPWSSTLSMWPTPRGQ